jgi:Fur family transcriptional regulator, ferric uptake regulator
MSRNAEAAIRAHRLRATAARVAVLEAVRASRRPVSHADLVRRLARQALDRATIFRNLAALRRVKLVHRLDLGDRVWRFVAAGDRAPGALAEFACTVCGVVVVLPDARLYTSVGRVSRGLALGELHIAVRGRCNECLR